MIREHDVKPRTDHRFLDIELARFIAALMVAMYHYVYWISKESVSEIGIAAAGRPFVGLPDLQAYFWFGDIGVDIFFVISGFVIFASVKNRSPKKFLISRLSRIYPPLIFYATITAVVTMQYSSIEWTTLILLWLKSLSLFPKGPWLDGVYWSLCVELFFYLLVYLTVRFSGEYRLRCFAHVLGALSTTAALVALSSREFGLIEIYNLLMSYKAKQLLVSTGSCFALGMLLYVYVIENFSARYLKYILLYMAGSCLWVLLRHDTVVGAGVGGSSVAVGVFLVILMILVYSLRMEWSGHPLMLKREKDILTLGSATYPLYLSHNIVGAYVIGRVCLVGFSPLLSFLVGLVFVVISSIAFGKYCDSRFRRTFEKGLHALSGSLKARDHEFTQ